MNSFQDREYTVCILGAGVMGTAVLSAILKSEFTPYPKGFICCTGSEESAIRVKHAFPNVDTSFGGNNDKAVSQSDVVILGCKPFMCEKILESVKTSIEGKLLISLAAGWTIDQLQKYSTRVARVMTNTPAKFGYGMAVISLNEGAEPDRELIEKLINPVGKAIFLPEKNMDAATSLVGSGPAFCLLMMESLIDGGVRMGIPYAAAKECAAKVMEGTARMVIETGDHPAVLKSAVCTPGGTTIGGLMVMEDKGLRSAIARGVEEAAVIAAQLGKK
ncbi:unnamed protein product [Kuraishia capsulata CBS 1993]|uniref:Pyrroline-5-carboxylate reductase n=1 Tax=Kuraishia capsulata CBS 1993 TaxID=1382522 RepID=W6MXR5_9ASCO|nr:uncharacterized protein KUCA_T00005338001 [Kuraishia capsulata CBS 1993]CDK29350.1 unnamed protein product [Kuraishia capsulata CBS 1993]